LEAKRGPKSEQIEAAAIFPMSKWIHAHHYNAYKVRLFNVYIMKEMIITEKAGY